MERKMGGGFRREETCVCLWLIHVGILEKGMASHSSVLAWRVPWMRSFTVYGPWGRKESDMIKESDMTKVT